MDHGSVIEFIHRADVLLLGLIIMKWTSLLAAGTAAFRRACGNGSRANSVGADCSARGHCKEQRERHQGRG